MTTQYNGTNIGLEYDAEAGTWGFKNIAQNFIDTNKYAIGLQSQTLRNANLQLRSDPPIASTMECNSPWNNTTIDKEARRPLSIGAP